MAINPFTGEEIVDNHKSGHGKKSRVAAAKKKRQVKKLNITDAEVILKGKGIKLVGGTQPKMVNGKFEAQYRIKEGGAKERTVSVTELQGML